MPLTLDNFVQDSSIGLVSLHGKAQGGGEKVIYKILNLRKDISIVTYKNILSTNKIILFTAGIRDLPLMLVAIFFRKKFISYIQVPFNEQYDNFSLLSFALYFWKLIHILFSNKIYINSSNLLPLFPNKSQILFPVMLSEMSLFTPKISKKISHFFFAGRFTKTKGIDAKNFDLYLELFKIAEEKLHNFKFHIYGEVDPECMIILHRYISKKIVIVHGFKADWFNDCANKTGVFLSNFEGFGLSVFEIRNKCKHLYISDAFPCELVSLLKNYSIVPLKWSPNQIFDFIFQPRKYG